MKKKTLLLFFMIILTFFIYTFYSRPDVEGVDTLYIDKNFEEESIEGLLRTDFENNETLTVGQLLVFYNRLLGNNVEDYQQAIDFCYDNDVFLPSDLVYNLDDWELLWRDIVLGNTVFEQVNEKTYSITLIPGSLKIYLNQQGYDLIKQGLIPPHLYFYSPFSTIKDLEIINLNRKASIGFALEVLMNIEYEKQNRLQILRELVIQQVQELVGVEEENWTNIEINLYNYYSLSYFGEFSYFKSKGFLEGIVLDDISSEIKVNDFLVLVNRILEV